jgi:hypothetical protein
MTVQEMRDYVRSFLDTDDEELPDTLVDVWLAEGTARIQRAFEPWSYYEASYTLTTASQTTAITSINSALEHIQGVQGPSWRLRYIPHQLAVDKYAWGDLTGEPVEFSIFAETLYLWPSPSASASYTVTGVRSPTEASAASDTVDLPSEFHPLVCEWMLARAYEQQDDDVMAPMKFARFEQQLEIFRRRYTRPPSPGIQAIGSQCSYNDLPPRLLFDFE